MKTCSRSIRCIEQTIQLSVKNKLGGCVCLIFPTLFSHQSQSILDLPLCCLFFFFFPCRGTALLACTLKKLGAQDHIQVSKQSL